MEGSKVSETIVGKIADAIIRMEGGDKPQSVCQQMVRKFGMWNVGHLVWAGQIGAKPCLVGDRQWAGWPTRAKSVAGVQRDVAAKIRRGDTLRKLITCYAPPIENNTSVYLGNVAVWTGLPMDTPLKDVNTEQAIDGAVRAGEKDHA